MTFEQALKMGLSILDDALVPDSLIDARILLEETSGMNRGYFLAHANEEIDPECENRYFELIKRRATRIPLQHITGYQDFMGLRFSVDENVLIPRQDTETLVEEALKYLHDGMRILDMCTGSGCILISLLNYSNDCIGVGADISDKALERAKYNADALLADRDDITISYVNSDIFSNISKDTCDRFDIIVSNPPYIKSDVIPTLMTEVREHDPYIALDGGTDGLLFYRRIIDEAMDYLNPNGTILLEIGYDEADEVTQMMQNKGFIDVSVVKDLSGLDRVVVGHKSCLTN